MFLFNKSLNNKFSILGLIVLSLMVIGLVSQSSLSLVEAQSSNLALNQPAVASSYQNDSWCVDCSPAKAVDGNGGTRWSSGSWNDGEWMYVDLGSTYNVTQVVLNWEAAYGSAYNIQVSADAVNWTTIFTENNGNGGLDNLTVSGTGRYVRMQGISRGTQYGYSLWEFEVYGNLAGPTNTPTPTATPNPVSTNIALNQPANSSSFENTADCPNCTASLAVDGNGGTRWASAWNDNEWIYVDLGGQATIERVVLNWEAAYATAYRLEVSNDTSSWSTIFTENNGNGGLDDITVSATGRYVRMAAISRALPYGYSLWDFEVYGTSGPPGPTPTPTSPPIYQDPNAAIPDRVNDLLSRMTLDEKLGQMTQAERTALSTDQDIATYNLGSLLSGGGSAPASNTPAAWADMVDGYQAIAMSTRLQIPLIYGIDAVHGHNNVYGATMFPHNIGLGATRNPALIEEIAKITAKEVYATGIPWDFSPCLCVARDERWGRTYESFGEHPEIATMMTSYIDGMQGTYVGGPGLGGVNGILATAKHWVGDGGTAVGSSTTGTYSLDQGDTILSEQELRDIHVAPYLDAISKGVGSVMPSYSSWNGQKMHSHSYLINDVLKGELGFTGFTISDWQAIDQIPGDYASDVRISINAGLDMIMVPYDYTGFINTIRNEVNAGNISMARIDDAVSRILTKKFELGLFEKPYSDRTYINTIGSQAHRDVARQAVRESLVLLKNDANTLPIPTNLNNILVAGNNANDIGNQSGGWTIEWQGASGNITPGTTILQGIQAHAGSATVTYKASPKTGDLNGKDLGIVVIGETPYAEGIGDDLNLTLSTADTNVVNSVCGAMPCVVILVSGRPMIINNELAQADAFVAAWLPGTEGDGVAEVLFGQYNFTGTLPMTWSASVNDLPQNVGDATYNPLFAYGFGLTYP